MPALSFSEGVLILLSGTALIVLFRIWRRFSVHYFSPVRHFRGPPNTSWLFGNLEDMWAVNVDMTKGWTEEYGHTIRIRGLFMAPHVYTVDTRAINHILTHSMDYYKPPESRKGLVRILGQGVLVMEGERHRQQRRVMNPAFGPAQIRELTEVFLEKAENLCNYWTAKIDPQRGVARVEVMDGLSRMTLDVIGLAGFNYEFDALNLEKPPNELNQAFAEIFKKPPKLSIFEIAKELVPGLSLLRNARTRMVDNARATMQRIGRQLIQDKKAAIMRESEKSGVVERKDVQGRDLLTVLIKANMATDIPDSQRMSDEDVLDQIPTFLVAGHETTSTATSWCLYALSRAPDIQQRLREELLSVPTDVPSMDELMELPYLDQVIRETLRLYAPVIVTSRVVQQDDVLPISEPFMDRHGNIVREIELKAGNRIMIPILALNTSKALWGEDAREFRPERWESPPEAAASVPGVWSHLLTFLGGPHACIGYRFSVVEMKALVFTLIRNFEFEFAFAPEDIHAMGTFLQRPSLRSEEKKGGQLPLLLRPYKHV